MSDEIKPMNSVFLKSNLGGRKRLIEEVFWPDHQVSVDHRIVDMDFNEACKSVIEGATPKYRNKLDMEPKTFTEKEDTTKLYREGV